MKNWIKHEKDCIESTQESVHGRPLLVTTCSRHRHDGKFQGYIVQCFGVNGYKELYFKQGYRYRGVIIPLIMLDYHFFLQGKD